MTGSCLYAHLAATATATLIADSLEVALLLFFH
jgi:hypothetical protein